MNESTKRSYRARIMQVGASVILAAALVIVAVSVVRPLAKKNIVEKKALAFGKLPAPGGRAAASSAAAALGRPGGEAFFEPVFEYAWTGGPWPDLPDKMAVYRRVAGEVSSADAKALAAKFGFTGEPEPDGGSGGIPGGPPTGVEPSAGGQTEPSMPGGGESPGASGAEGVSRLPEPGPVEPAPYKSFRFYDQTSGKRLEIFEAEARFSYMVEGAWQAMEKEPDAGPADAQAKEVAKGFLKDKGLLPDDYTGPFIADMGVVSSAIVSPDGAEPTIEEAPKVTRPPYAEVQFGKKLGVYDLVEPSGEPSRYIASVTVGAGGAIMAASGEIPAPLEESAYPLMGVAEAFDEVKKGNFGVRALGAPVPLIERDQSQVEPAKPEPVKIELTQVKLAYLLIVGGDRVGYFEPAYLFSGKIGQSGGGSDYSMAVPAIAPAHIKPQ